MPGKKRRQPDRTRPKRETKRPSRYATSFPDESEDDDLASVNTGALEDNTQNPPSDQEDYALLALRVKALEAQLLAAKAQDSTEPAPYTSTCFQDTADADMANLARETSTAHRRHKKRKADKKRRRTKSARPKSRRRTPSTSSSSSSSSSDSSSSDSESSGSGSDTVSSEPSSRKHPAFGVRVGQNVPDKIRKNT